LSSGNDAKTAVNLFICFYRGAFEILIATFEGAILCVHPYNLAIVYRKSIFGIVYCRHVDLVCQESAHECCECYHFL
jgi:hypothetical protein